MPLDTPSGAQPTLAIVIINYNYAAFLEAAINSALNQQQPADRILVIDDGSTDDSRTIINRYGNRIQSHFKVNGGQSSSYNACLNLLQEDLVLLLDSDDMLEPECVEKVRVAWQPDAVKLQFPLKFINAEGIPTGGMIPRVKHTGEVRQIALKFGGYISPPSSGNVYSRDYLQRIFPLDESSRYSADCIPSTLAPCYGEIISLNKNLGMHRIHRFHSHAGHAEGQGLNHSHVTGWLRRAVLRDYRAFLKFKQHLLQQTGHPYPHPLPYVPSMLRYMAIHQRAHPPLPELPPGRTLCRAGILASIQYPGYSLYERCMLLLWFTFLWLAPKYLISCLMRYHLGIAQSGSPQWTIPPR